MAMQNEVKQKLGDVSGGALGLSQDVCRQVCDLLNTDLASEFVLYHQYKKHHWVVEGTEFASLHKFLDTHADGVREIADKTAERITYMHGVPYSKMSTMEQKAFIQCEGDDVYDLRSMLEHDLQANITVVQKFRQQVEQCQGYKDFGTQFCLMEWITKHETWIHELDSLLADESLSKGISLPGRAQQSDMRQGGLGGRPSGA